MAGPPLSNELSFRERPSSWPIRNQRRHCAAMAFQNRVFDMLTDISKRLELLEQNFEQCVALPPGLFPCETANSHSEIEELCALSSRFEKMELLLLRMPMSEFLQFDERVNDLIMKASPMEADNSAEPEVEQFPEKKKTASTERSESVHANEKDKASRATLFTIFDDNIADANTQTEDSWQDGSTRDDLLVASDVQTQTSKVRIHGRATQTIQPTRTTEDIGTQFNGLCVDDALGALLTPVDQGTIKFCSSYPPLSDIRPCIWQQMDTPCCGDIIKMGNDATSDDGTVQVLIPKNAKGRIAKIDQDGDMEIFFPHLLDGCYGSFPRWFATRWIMKDKIESMQKIVDPTMISEAPS